jgi:hypothetical protein
MSEMVAKIQRSITFELSDNFRSAFCNEFVFSYNKQKSKAYFVKLVKNDRSIQYGGSESFFM